MNRQPGAYKYNAQVERVIDGDTIDVLIRWDIGFNIICETLQRLRFARIDAPEVRGDDREAGNAATLALRSFLEQYDGQVIVQTEKDDSFGRYIADVYVVEWGDESGDEVINVNDWLVRNGFAVYREY